MMLPAPNYLSQTIANQKLPLQARIIDLQNLSGDQNSSSDLSQAAFQLLSTDLWTVPGCPVEEVRLVARDAARADLGIPTATDTAPRKPVERENGSTDLGQVQKVFQCI